LGLRLGLGVRSSTGTGDEDHKVRGEKNLRCYPFEGKVLL
jgi:hypothetical protein